MKPTSASLKPFRRFARELAQGVIDKQWNNEFYLYHEFDEIKFAFTQGYNSEELKSYLESEWENNYPDISMLETLGFIERGSAMGDMIFAYYLTEDAIKLIDEVPPASVFISYRRAESSALALLILARMREHDLSPYLDMHPENDGEKLELGSDWANALKSAIEERDKFIVLLAPTTLSTPSYVIQELEWATNCDPPKWIIPVWHNGFNVDEHLPENLPDKIAEAVKSTHGTKVEKENPKQYNAMLDELLAHFGIMP